MLTWAEVDLEAIKFNLKAIQDKVGNSKAVIGVVKANAYGHGALQVAKVLTADNGVSMLAVATLDEALELRSAGFTTPILTLFNILPEQIHDSILNDITLSISCLKLAKEISQKASRLNLLAKLHLKVDTGMGRIGIHYSEALDFVQKLIQLPNIKLEGIYTHFATADEDDKSYALLQLSRFNEAISQVSQVSQVSQFENLNLRTKLLKHCANSAAILSLPPSYINMDLVRPGLALYGLYPSDSLSNSKPLRLKAALTWKSWVMYLKNMQAGDSVSYGRSYIVSKTTKIATLPVGYADGYPRTLSHKAEVLIRGVRSPLVGRICMDQVMCDVGHISGVEVGDEAVLIGKQKDAEITVEEIAKKTDTVNYEVVCGIGNRVKRIYPGFSFSSNDPSNHVNRKNRYIYL